MYNAEEVCLVAHESQSSLLNHLVRLTIPVAADSPNLTVGKAILQPADEPHTAPAVLK